MKKTKRFGSRTRSPNNETKIFERNNLFEILFRGCEGYLELRAIRKGSYPKTENIALKEDWNINYILVGGFCNKYKDYNISFGVATRKSEKGGKKADVINIPCVWADIDYKNISKDEFEQRLSKFPLKPTIIVFSGNGLHLYWLFDNPVNRAKGEDIEKVNDGIASELGGDNVRDIARVMRLPDTENHKYDSKPICKIKEINSNTYTLDKFLEKVPKNKNVTKRKLPARKLPPDILEEQIKYICDQIVKNEIIISEDDTYIV